MSDFREYSAAFHSHQSDILMHHGVKGMKWGVIRWKDKFKSMFDRFKRENSFGDNRDDTKDKVMNELTTFNVGNETRRKALKSEWKKNKDVAYNLDLAGNKAYRSGDVKGSEKIWSESKNYLEKSKKLDELHDLYSRNCPKTTMALELKKRGIEVVPNKKSKPINMESIQNMWVNEKVTKCKKQDDFYNPNNYGKPGDHGAIYGNRSKGTGHIFNYTVLKDGTVQLEDAQNGKVMSLQDAKRTGDMSISGFVSGSIINLTKAELDMDEVRKYNMFSVNMSNGNDMKLAQYERDVKKYIKNKKRVESFMNKYEKSKKKVNDYLKKLTSKLKKYF